MADILQLAVILQDDQLNISENGISDTGGAESDIDRCGNVASIAGSNESNADSDNEGGHVGMELGADGNGSVVKVREYSEDGSVSSGVKKRKASVSDDDDVDDDDIQEEEEDAEVSISSLEASVLFSVYGFSV